jgi:hypothetical protein
MTTNRKFVRRHLRGKLTRAQEMELWLGPSHRGSAFRSREELQRAWLTHRDRVMTAYAKRGRRPLGWWEFEAAPLAFPGPNRERSTLSEHGLLAPEERIDLLNFWRREFERSLASDFRLHAGGRILTGVAARRAHYRWADIPAELVKAWDEERRDDEKGIVNTDTPGEAAEHPMPTA